MSIILRKLKLEDKEKFLNYVAESRHDNGLSLPLEFMPGMVYEEWMKEVLNNYSKTYDIPTS